MHPASFDHDNKERILVVCGPTATGKTGLALRLAREVGGEIVGADSRQVYRCMDIGTAKPTPAQQALAPHYLIDVVDPDEPFTLADYLDRARAAVADILARGRVPIVAGGTGLYIRALVQGFDVPRVPPNAALRRELEDLAAMEGTRALLERLRRADSAVAATVDGANPRRLIRAIEVAEATLGARVVTSGDPTSMLTPTGIPIDVVAASTATGAGAGAGAGWKPALLENVTGGAPAIPVVARGYDAFVVGLTADRAVLHERADRRVAVMMADGFLDEVRGLYARGYAPTLPALSSLGYRELGESLRGLASLADAVQATKVATHRFIRRQLTWFRREPTIHWFDITDRDAAGETARLCARWLSVPPTQAARGA